MFLFWYVTETSLLNINFGAVFADARFCLESEQVLGHNILHLIRVVSVFLLS